MSLSVDDRKVIRDAARAIAHSITATNAAPTNDAAGGRVESLTEAVMGVTKSLQDISDTLGDILQALHPDE